MNPSDKSRFYINVCHDVLQTGDASVCDDDAAICAVGKVTFMALIFLFHSVLLLLCILVFMVYILMLFGFILQVLMARKT